MERGFNFVVLENFAEFLCFFRRVGAFDGVSGAEAAGQDNEHWYAATGATGLHQCGPF